jgi:hypothetical protein
VGGLGSAVGARATPVNAGEWLAPIAPPVARRFPLISVAYRGVSTATFTKASLHRLSLKMPNLAWLKPGLIVLRKLTIAPCPTRRKRVVLWQEHRSESRREGGTMGMLT